MVSSSLRGQEQGRPTQSDEFDDSKGILAVASWQWSLGGATQGKGECLGRRPESRWWDLHDWFGARALCILHCGVLILRKVLADRWGLGLETVKRRLEVTTQVGVQKYLHRVAQWFKMQLQIIKHRMLL
jgi:hypothetical protein